MPPIRILEISGSPYEMGFTHGQQYARQIREITAERIHLCSDETWTGRNLSRKDVLALAEQCLEAHYAYAPDQMLQLEGVADATGLTLAELIITNGFTDFVDVIYNVDAVRSEPSRIANECTAVLVGPDAAAGGQGMMSQTWDMHATATPYVVLLRGRPEGRPAFLALTITGCVGMIGMNEAGIAVGINNLVGADGQVGVTWPFVCRKVLNQTNLDDALACITEAPLAGGHNYLLMDAAGQGYNVEAMASALHITELDGGILTHANQCHHDVTQAAERSSGDEAIADSATRVNRAQQFLSGGRITPEKLMALTRDRSDGAYSVCAMSDPPYYSETCCAAVMRPTTHELWGVWGLPTENDYQRFVV